MREILFRGKRKVCEEWVYGFPFISRKCEYKIKWYDDYYGSSKTSEIYPESLGQFTGLTDENGKKIFEGDIVTVKDEIWGSPFCYGITGKIVYDEASFFIEPKDVMETQYLFNECAVYEVIGNIHDNPELLED